jgi:hypothetical protein
MCTRQLPAPDSDVVISHFEAPAKVAKKCAICRQTVAAGEVAYIRQVKIPVGSTAGLRYRVEWQTIHLECSRHCRRDV